MDDLEAREVRHRTLEARVLAPRHDERVEVVLRHRYANVRVAALELQVQVHEASNPLTSAVTASLRGVGTPSPARSADAAAQVVDLRRTAPLDVLEHARLVVVRDVQACGVVDELLRVRVESDPLRGGDRLPFVDERADEGAEIGPLAHAAVREPGQRPTGFVAALKITLRHWAVARR